MHDVLYLSDSRNKNQFRIDYPYYGLFGSAEVTAFSNNNETVYTCKLLNGTIIQLKKLKQPKKWIDATLNAETPLSLVIGNSIDDFLNAG